MIDIVIEYHKDTESFKLYEPTTDTLIVSSNLTEALVNLSTFLDTSGLGNGDILVSDNINYHIDSATMKAMIESNVNLMKKLNSGPSGFTRSSQKFGGGSTNNILASSRQRRESKKSSDFSKGSSFKKSMRKFGFNKMK